MEGVAEGDDLVGAIAVEASPFARQLDRAFVSLGPGVQKMHLIAARAVAQAFSQVQHAAIEKTGAGVDQ